MEIVVIILSAVVCFLIGVVWLKDRALKKTRRVALELQIRLEEERRGGQEKLQLIKASQEELKMAFQALSAESLKSATHHFFEIAKETFDKYQVGMQQQFSERAVTFDGLVKPLKESLEKVDHKIQELEKSRVGAYSGLMEQLKSMASSQELLQNETSRLVKALRLPHVRGKWGEVQLRRVVEMAGMVEHCDFETQVTERDIDSHIRPDMIVRLPNRRIVVVDAKAPLQAYLEALETQDEEERHKKLIEHARQLKKHLTQLGDKTYSEQFENSPEFVVLFLPAESFYSAALEKDPGLIEFGVDKKVLIATPTTLIALLRAVAFGFREEAIAKHALTISEMGKTLYERLQSVVDHLQKLKRALDTSCDAYNKTVGCFESRVLVAARKFEEMGVVPNGATLEILEPIEKVTKQPENVTTY